MNALCASYSGIAKPGPAWAVRLCQVIQSTTSYSLGAHTLLSVATITIMAVFGSVMLLVALLSTKVNKLPL